MLTLFLCRWRPRLPFCPRITPEKKHTRSAVYSTNDLAALFGDRSPIDESKNRFQRKNKYQRAPMTLDIRFCSGKKTNNFSPTAIHHAPFPSGGHSTRCNLLDPSASFYFPACSSPRHSFYSATLFLFPPSTSYCTIFFIRYVARV